MALQKRGWGLSGFLVIEEWSYKRNFGYHLSDILDAMDRMLILAGLAGGTAKTAASLH